MSPAYALAHVFYPNTIKLKGPVVVIAAHERKDKVFFDQVWSQAHTQHNPEVGYAARGDYRVGVITLPPPNDTGEAFMACMMIHKTDPSFYRYFLLEYDYMVLKRTNRTVLTERHNKDHFKLGEGPVLTGNFETDMTAFIDLALTKLGPRQIAR